MKDILNKIKNKIKFTLVESGLNTHYKKRGKSQIIMYHGIDRFEDKQFNSRFISKENFEAQIILFKEKFDIVDLETYHKNPISTNGKLRIAITFDDGYQNNYNYALPILDKHKVPATFFITGLNNTPYSIIWSDFYDLFRVLTNKPSFIFNGTSYSKKKNHYLTQSGQPFASNFKLDLRPMSVKMEELFQIGGTEMKAVLNNPKYNDYWKLMTDTEISSCSKSKYVKIGSHAFTHCNLGNISNEDAILELTKSKAYLEMLCEYEINTIGYPDGSYTEQLLSESLNVGFSIQCAVKYLHEKDKDSTQIMDRFGLYPLNIPDSTNRISYLIEKSSEK
jgi:peptidoglycan/xylan/chitin deacetylase (PgdA/CDA1 family)